MESQISSSQSRITCHGFDMITERKVNTYLLELLDFALTALSAKRVTRNLEFEFMGHRIRTNKDFHSTYSQIAKVSDATLFLFQYSICLRYIKCNVVCREMCEDGSSIKSEVVSPSLDTSGLFFVVDFVRIYCDACVINCHRA